MERLDWGWGYNGARVRDRVHLGLVSSKKKCEHLQKNLGLGLGTIIVNPKLRRGVG